MEPSMKSDTVCRFYDYLCSVPAYKASQILGLQGPDTDFETFASSTVAAIPPQYFSQPLPIVNGPRFELRDGNLTLVTNPTSPPHVNWPSGNLPTSTEQNATGLVPARPPTRLRSLNSFMVFRSFMAPLFYGVMQKQKSTAISLLWNVEPLKAQWGVMAKAYTTLRDNFDLDGVPLSVFTATVVPLFGIPPAFQYLTLLGWEIHHWTDLDGQTGFDVNQSFDADVSSLNLQPVCVDNIIEHWRGVYGLIPKAGTAWPFPPQGYSALALDTQRGMENPQSLPDPLGWMFNDHSERQDGPVDEFHLIDMYDEPDSDMDPILDLVHIPPGDQGPSSEEEEAALASELERLFPSDP